MTMSANKEATAEELKADDSYPSKKKKLCGNAFKIACAAGGFIAVVALCVLSSRFSWFGVQANENTISYDNDTVSSPMSTAPTLEESIPSETSRLVTSSQTAVTTPKATATEAVATSKATATKAVAAPKATATEAVTTPKATATASDTTPTSTAVATTPATTAAPKPAWTEEKRSGTMYIKTASCSARKEGLQGSKVVSFKHYGDAVNVTAITDTGYYKLDDGTYIHSDYLTDTKPVETTTASASAPTPSTTPAQSNMQIYSAGITDEPVNCSAEEAEVFRIVNELRVSYGLTPYKWDANAYKAAKKRCDEAFDVFSHLRPDGTKFYTVYGINSEEDKNTVFKNVGENLGSGQPTAQKVVDCWMASTAGHRENILNSDIENMAVAFGTYNDDFKYYWVQEFTTYR